MKKLLCGIHAVLFLNLVFFPNAWADENEIVALREQISKLNERLEDLEASQARPTNVVPSSEVTGGPYVESALEGVRLSGYVDTAYHWNLNGTGGITPTGTAVDRNQSIGVFDTVGDSFTFHALKLTIEKAAEATGGVGFRADILAGQDAKVIASAGTESDEFDIEQAYVEARLPITALEGNEVFGDSVYFRAGKYVTLAGAEVIESKDNWNVTRSLLFGYAIPFTHTGIRAAYDLWGGKVTLTTGLVNGWDATEDNNRYKTWEGQIALKPNDELLFTATTYIGPENLNTVDNKRGLLDLVALWKATDKLSLMANFDYGREGRAAGTAVTRKTADWDGYALYARYQANDKLAFAGRAELFVDHDIFRVGAGAVTGGVPREQKYWEYTLTSEYKLYSNLITRLEYRFDWAEAPVFQGESNQNVISAQLIYNFA